ncbi:MAG: hypothetical protein KPEEDBHJ_03660 [Anaerolineales bacterium]|nr:hypothetical protein [Anaerolineales bacterium]
MSDFPLVELHSTSIQIIDGDRGVNYPKKTEFSEQGYCLFLDSSNLTKNGFDFSSKTFISKAVDERMGKGRLQRGDLVMNTRGTIGNIGLYSDNIPFESVRINSGMVIIRGGKDYDTRFLYLFLRSNLFFLQTKNLMSGSVQKQLPVSVIKYVKLPKVNLPTQQKIAAVLSALDAKIELNQRINAELESMAKTLYDYWFVQFAPHKSAGGKMVWNEELKRNVPAGWEVKTLGTVCDIYQPKTISEKEMMSDGKYLVFGANGIVGRYDKFNHVESEIVITCRGASCGNILRTRPNSWITGNAMVIHSTSESISSEFVFQALGWLDIRKVITGSAQPQITRTNLVPLKLLVPPTEILQKFNEFCKPNVEKRLSILRENDQLTELRDWLLPMLMNGQVKVS